MNIYYLKKFRKRYSYEFGIRGIITILDHKEQKVHNFTNINSVISTWLSEYPGVYVKREKTKTKRKEQREYWNKVKTFKAKSNIIKPYYR